MQRLEQIQRFYNATCANRLSGQPGIKLTPAYYSIYSEDRVDRNEDIVRSITGNPEYILCFVKAPQKWHDLEELFCIIDREGNNLEGIILTKWKLKNIITNTFNTIESIEILLLDKPDQIIILKFEGFDYHKKLTVSQLWKFMTEIDLNCNNVHELEIYKKYFLAKTELDKTQLTLAEFQHKHFLNHNIINKYKDLLHKIEEMINGDIKISKT